MYVVDPGFRETLDRGFTVVRAELEKGYREESQPSEQFLNYLENDLVEAMGYAHSDRDFPESFEESTESIVQKYTEKDIERYSGLYDVEPANIQITEFYQFLTGSFRPEQYEVITGIAFSGIPLLKAAENHFDAEPSIIRFSQYDEDDQEVMENPLYEENFKDSSVLVLDDVIFSGETLEMTGKYLEEQGAENVDAAVINNFSDQYTGKVYSLVKEGEYTGIEEDGRGFGLSYEKRVRNRRKTVRRANFSL